MGKLYTAAGWIDWDYIIRQPETFIPVVGPRGTGKTYGIFQWLIDHGEKFIYVRRLKSQLDECKTDAGNPFKKLNEDHGWNIVPCANAGKLLFRKENREGDIVAAAVALSVVANVRGIDFSDYNYIVFDEFIASDGERPIKNEFSAFLNFYETVNRNRELLGQPAVKCFMLGNANRISNPYFGGWHLMKRVLNMIRGRQMVWRSADKTMMVILLLDSPISARKRDTALYKNASDDFLSMALDNAFRTDETKIKSEPLKEYKHIVSAGEIGIYEHKTERKYFVSSTTSQPIYQAYGISLKMFRQDFYMFRIYYMLYKNIFFESFEVELLFRELFDL